MTGPAHFEGLPKLFPAIPDAASAAPAGDDGPQGFAAALTAALGGANGALVRADASERAFASGHGGLQQMVLDRAQADVALSLASAAATRTAQTISTILAMQV
jgi:flagellar hook-basal body complex protein FliE